jgi:tetratricopeptide (TPR) repeat protein
MAIPDLVETGIRAYLAGREAEALDAFEEVLRLDPDNAKARWYVDRMGEASRTLAGSRRGAGAAKPAAAPVAPVRTLPAAPRPDLARLERDLDLEPPEPAAPLFAAAPAQALEPPAPAFRPVSSAPVEAFQEEAYAPSPWDDGPAAAAPIVLEASGGLDLAAVAEKSDLRPLVPEGVGARTAPRTDVEVWLSAAKELFALGDFSGSLELIEKILQVDPEHGEARDYLRQNEATLISMYESKLGPLTAVPRLAVKPEEILWLNLDHRAGFLLAQIDGTVDYDSLFALSGLPRLDTARILANLIADGVIQS